MFEAMGIRYPQKSIKLGIPQTKDVQSSFISKKAAVIVNCVFVVTILLFGVISFSGDNSYINSLHSQYFDVNTVDNAYEYADFAYHQSEKFNMQPEPEGKQKRDSKSASSSSSKKHKSTKPLDEPVIRFLLVLAGLIVLNMIAICIHHLFLKATRSEKSYRTIEQNISPF